ncbi:dienelactone hydrolase family protein [Acidobacteria bacterium AB60]|nr:dienelactone hydrolase family protein [Acidobacteria bacterium AB60]
MPTQELKLILPDGTTDAALHTPDPDQPQPGILLLPDVAGPRPVLDQVARDLAAQEYTVLLPNPFYRTGEPPLFHLPRKPGDPATAQRVAELLAPLTPDAIDRDIAAWLDFLTLHPSVAPGPVAVVGFCIGGLMAFRAAAVRPAKVAVAVSFHGGRLYQAEDPNSAHRNLPKITARLYFGHAVEDKSMPSEAIAALDQALQDWGGHYETEVYPGAHHGWTLADNPTYNQPQAERAFAKLTSILKETFPVR